MADKKAYQVGVMLPAGYCEYSKRAVWTHQSVVIFPNGKRVTLPVLDKYEDLAQRLLAHGQRADRLSAKNLAHKALYGGVMTAIETFVIEQWWEAP